MMHREPISRNSGPLAVVLVLLLVPTTVYASVCSFVSVVDMSFGSYDVFSAVPLDSTGSVTYNCTSVGEFDVITIDLDTGGATGFSPREMSYSTEKLNYNLYIDAARTNVWGDGTSGTSHYGPTTPPEGTNVAVTSYGRVFALQNVAAGSYSDTVVVTVNY